MALVPDSIPLNIPSMEATLSGMKTTALLLLAALLLAPGASGLGALVPADHHEDAGHETRPDTVSVLCHSLTSLAAGQTLHACGGATALLPPTAGAEAAPHAAFLLNASAGPYHSRVITPPDRPPDHMSV